MNRYAHVIIAILSIQLTSGTIYAESMRVAIMDNQRTVKLQSSAGLRIEGNSARSLGKEELFTAAAMGNSPLRVTSAQGQVKINGHTYRGTVELRKKGNGTLLVVNELDLESYLLGVVAAEVPSDWELEVLKAQAIASRTYALYQKQLAGRRPYHILSTVDGQMYLGKRAERQRAAQAVQSTRGMVISYRGKVIPAFYHASCGGHTEDAFELWGIDEPFLKGVDCDCQDIAKYGSWEKRVDSGGIARALRRGGYRLGDISSVEIDGMTAAGRVKNVLFRHTGGSTSVPAESLRATLGYMSLPSVFFEPEMVDREVVLSGRGMGHGVGLCQWGAKEMARRGYDYRAILAYYYPGTTLVRMGR